MRRIRRGDLSPEAVGLLWERRLQVVEAGDRHPQDREAAQYKEADRLWDLKDNKAFKEIRRRLREDMAPGDGHCMYCEYTFGNVIDHFRPMQKYPTRAFEWDNYLWACTLCNTHHKGTQFPLDKNGLPLLIDPTREDPREHLQLAPGEGKLVGLTPKGIETIHVLGFDARGYLDRARARAWQGIQGLLLLLDEAYQRADAARVDALRSDFGRDPIASLLALLIELIDDPARAHLVQEPRCAEVLARHPEIRSWM